ncbi:hypothetical protein [Streptomyces sp. JW3]|uniref:hypothetical protein n=1 Tax=Streptomyces sp. JW3 TaxID=3456955 RepID=UPI003FA42653
MRPRIAERAVALLGTYGTGDWAVLHVLFGRVEAVGRLPFQLSGPMAEVEAGRPDVPPESTDPLRPTGHGLPLPR